MLPSGVAGPVGFQAEDGRSPDRDFLSDMCGDAVGDDVEVEITGVVYDDATRTASLMPAAPLADDLYRRIGTADHSRRTLFLMRGCDRSGCNDFVLRH